MVLLQIIVTAANKSYVDTQNSRQDIAINEKASKSFVENEDLKLMDYLGNVGYSYAMDSYIHGVILIVLYLEISIMNFLKQKVAAF